MVDYEQFVREEQATVNRYIRFCGMSVFLLLAALISLGRSQQNSKDTNWPSFRGPNASGIAEGYPLPLTWDVTTSKNILWKTPIPGLGHSSPVVWGNRIFLSTSISGKENPVLKVTGNLGIASVPDDTFHRWIVYCLDKQSGKIIWERTVYSGVPKIKRHPKSTHANATIATDGRHLVAFFGSEGLYCFDFDGKLLWKKDLGTLDSSFYTTPSAQWEFASSPVIYRDSVLIQCDVLNGSFIAALNIKDGTEIWRTSRDEVPTWGTPTVYDDGKVAQMIVNGYKNIGSYDVKTGKELWQLHGGGDIPIPTPILSHDMVYITSAHGTNNPIFAIRLNGTGDISLTGDETSNRFIAWSALHDGAYITTPLVYGDYFYSCKYSGVLSCYEAKNGNRMYQERLGEGTSGYSASPVAGDGKIYFTGEEGDVYVLKPGPKLEILSKNPMGEICMATPAISGGVIYFRTQSSLVAVSAK